MPLKHLSSGANDFLCKLELVCYLLVLQDKFQQPACPQYLKRRGRYAHNIFTQILPKLPRASGADGRGRARRGHSSDAWGPAARRLPNRRGRITSPDNVIIDTHHRQGNLREPEQKRARRPQATGFGSQVTFYPRKAESDNTHGRGAKRDDLLPPREEQKRLRKGKRKGAASAVTALARTCSPPHPPGRNSQGAGVQPDFRPAGLGITASCSHLARAPSVARRILGDWPARVRMTRRKCGARGGARAPEGRGLRKRRAEGRAAGGLPARVTAPAPAEAAARPPEPPARRGLRL